MNAFAVSCGSPAWATESGQGLEFVLAAVTASTSGSNLIVQEVQKLDECQKRDHLRRTIKSTCVRSLSVNTHLRRHLGWGTRQGDGWRGRRIPRRRHRRDLIVLFRDERKQGDECKRSTRASAYICVAVHRLTDFILPASVLSVPRSGPAWVCQMAILWAHVLGSANNHEVCVRKGEREK